MTRGQGGGRGYIGEGNDGPLPSASLPHQILQFLSPPVSLFFDAVFASDALTAYKSVYLRADLFFLVSASEIKYGFKSPSAG